MMRAWVITKPGPIDGNPLRLVERPVPEPGPGEVRVRVTHCGVCRTDLHLAEGDLPPHRPPEGARRPQIKIDVVPGHEVVGIVDAVGTGSGRCRPGRVLRTPWLPRTGGAPAPPPEPLDAAILFAPVGNLVPTALAALDRGGTLAVAGIHMSPIPGLDYETHLFQERTLRSVTANTRQDGREFLAAAARIPVRATTHRYPFEEAPQALRDLAHGAFTGAAGPALGASFCGRTPPAWQATTRTSRA